MPKLIIHCEVEPPDGEVEPTDGEVENVIESINKIQMMSAADKARLVGMLLSLANQMPDHLMPVAAALSHAMLLVQGKTSTIYIKD